MQTIDCYYSSDAEVQGFVWEVLKRFRSSGENLVIVVCYLEIHSLDINQVWWKSCKIFDFTKHVYFYQYYFVDTLYYKLNLDRGCNYTFSQNLISSPFNISFPTKNIVRSAGNISTIANLNSYSCQCRVSLCKPRCSSRGLPESHCHCQPPQ